MIYDLFLNHHTNGILDYTIYPAPNVEQISEAAESIIRTVMEALDYVGVLAIELFDCNGKLSINEMAPRVHNSGHITQDAALRSQFDNHVRAVAGLPVEDINRNRKTVTGVMVNLIGELGDLKKVQNDPEMKLHLYGKSERPGRKIGHVNIQLETISDIGSVIQSIREKSAIQ